MWITSLYYENEKTMGLQNSNLKQRSFFRPTAVMYRVTLSCKSAIATVLFIVSLSSCSSNTKPQPGISISFDDRTIREWYDMRGLLNSYNAKVTFFVTQFDSLLPAEIDMLKTLESDGHEIGSHGAIHVNAEYFIKAESYDKYLQSEIEPSISAMKKAGFNPTSFAYPYGAKYWFTDYLLKKEFKVLRSVSAIPQGKDISDLDDIFYGFDNDRTVSSLGIDVNSGTTTIMIEKSIKRALAKNEVILLYGHAPSDSTISTSYQFDLSFLESILKLAKENNLRYYRMNDLAEEIE